MASRRRSASEWRRLVDEWQCSGLPAETFAARRRLKVATLRWWRWKLGGEVEPPGDPAAVSFLEVVVGGATPEAPDLIVELGELRVRVPYGFDAGELRRLVGALC